MRWRGSKLKISSKRMISTLILRVKIIYGPLHEDWHSADWGFSADECSVRGCFQQGGYVVSYQR
jgi:hypothetical protein